MYTSPFQPILRLQARLVSFGAGSRSIIMPATLEEKFGQCVISSISDATWSAGPVSRPWAIAARQDRPESSQSVRFSGRIAVHGIENCQVLHGFENEPFWFSRPVQLHIFWPNPIPVSFQVLVGHALHIIMIMRHVIITKRRSDTTFTKIHGS